MNTTFHIRIVSLAIAVGSLAVLSACGKGTTEANGAPPSVSVGTEIDDSVVTAQVKSALLDNLEVKSFDLKVETRKGEVMLSGFVDNPAQMDRAVAVARGVSGVKEVTNKMDLKGQPTTVGNKIDDSVITTRIKAALLADPSVKSLDIAVVTRKGEVQLSGFVNSRDQMDQAVKIAQGTEGVMKVGNEMSVKK
jgi:hyperosmotically inducible protein